MTIDEILVWLEKTANIELTSLQQIILIRSWQGKTYKEMGDETKYSEKHLKNIGSEIWELLSSICQEKITKKNFKFKFCNSISIISCESNHEDWGNAPDLLTFFGRTTELDTLETWILQESCQLVVIVGLAGIGKTNLAVKLGKGGIGKTDLSLKFAKGVQKEYDYIIWRSLLNAPSLKDILSDLVSFFSNQTEISLSSNLDTQISRLIHYFKIHRCLLILDNGETILEEGIKAGKYRQDYEDYGQLFKAIGTIKHQSCLLLTSREKPESLDKIANPKSSIRFLELGGLEAIQGKKIFRAISDDWLASEEEWQEIIEFYNGNPLALELAAHHIQSVFWGDISQFLYYKKPIFNDISELLDWHCKRLSDREKEIIFWLVINREPSSIEQLYGDLLSLKSKQESANTLQALQRRLPLERTKNKFFLQPVLIEYGTQKLIEQVTEEFLSQQLNLFNQYALIKALSKDYIRNTQYKLIIQPIVDHLLARFYEKSSLETLFQKMLQQFSSDPYLKTGYASGNLLNILCYLQTDLKNYNFSNLKIQQAFLQGMNLAEVNFENAEFSQCVFTQSFGGVHSVGFSPDGTLLAMGDSHGEIRLLDVKNNQLCLHLPGHGISMWVTSLTFTRDGRKIISSSFDKTVKVWDLETGQCLKILKGHTKWIWTATISPDDQIIASGSDDSTIRIWDLETGQCLKILQGHQNWVWSVAFSPDGEILGSASYDHTIKLWNYKTGECLSTLEGHQNSVWSIAFSPDSQTIVSAGLDKTVRLWDRATSKCYQIFYGHSKEVRAVAFHPNGQLIASGSFDATIRLWDIKRGKCLRTLQGHPTSVRSLAFSPNGEILASGDHNQVVKLWDPTTGKCLTTLQGYVNWIWTIALSPNSHHLASGGLDQNIRIWDLNTNECLMTLQGHENWVWSVAFSLDGQILASSCDDETIKLWNVNTGKCFRTLRGHTNGGVWKVAFSPKDPLLVSAGQDGTIRFWQLNTGECLMILQAHSTWIWSVIFSSDGRFVASCSDDETVKLWDVSSGTYQKTLQESWGKVMSLAFSPNSQILAMSNDSQQIRLLNIDSSKCLYTFNSHSQMNLALAFSPDGSLLAVGGDQCIIEFWDVQSGQHLKTFQGHTSWVLSIVFSFDGQLLFSGSIDGTLKIWEVETGLCLKTLKNPRPYEGMNIKGVIGLTLEQKIMLKDLGSVDGT